MISRHPGYPYHTHPCWSDCRNSVWERIHLPVARDCNVKCRFCNHGLGSACHSFTPGTCARLMRPEDAIERVSDELARRPRLRIAAVSGPGEPLANRDTFVLFDGLQRLGKELEFCLSTNGALLSESVGQLQDLGINAVSVSMNAITPEAAARIYEWAVLDGDRLTGVAMGEELIRKQLEGIQAARGIGIHVKVNTVLIPAVNDREIDPLSRSLKMAGAELHNIVPLIPNGDLSEVPRPTSDEIAAARRTSSTYMRQLLSCAQCRSDVVGIPGHDTLL